MKYTNLFKPGIAVTAMLVCTSPVFAQTSPLNIGSLPAGKTVVIGYDVTVNSGNSVSNQAMISGNEIQTIVSNDPKTPAPYDPTTTVVLGVVPVTLTNVQAYTKMINGQDGVQVEWTTNNEINLDKYNVERSATGQQFMKIGTVAARNGISVNTYNLFDQLPLPGNNFYRVKSIDRSGSEKYSHIVKVNISKGNGTLVVYPNPVRDGQLIIGFENPAKAIYTVELVSQLGQKVFTTTIDHAGGSSSHTLKLPNVAAGSYQVVISKGKTRLTETVIIQ